MKKIAMLLCAALMISMLASCGKDNPEPAGDTSSAASTGASQTTSMPSTPAEIYGHNMQIDESAISLKQFETPAAGSKIATIKTSLGDIKIALYPDEAPKAVENFIALAEKGYYNGLKFYEVVPGVRVTTGDPNNDGTGGDSNAGGVFSDEYSLNLWHFNGAEAMDNGGAPNQNTSRFFIVQNSEITTELADEMLDGGFPESVVQKYLDVGGVPNYDFRDTVFGQVIEGMDVVEKIAAVERDGENKPKEDIAITSVEISEM